MSRYPGPDAVLRMMLCALLACGSWMVAMGPAVSAQEPPDPQAAGEEGVPPTQEEGTVVLAEEPLAEGPGAEEPGEPPDDSGRAPGFDPQPAVSPTLV